MDNQPSGPVADAGNQNDVSGSSKVTESESEPAVHSLQDRIKWLEQHVVKKVRSFILALQVYVGSWALMFAFSIVCFHYLKLIVITRSIFFCFFFSVLLF